MFSLDTETTGLDLRHAARPFFVTCCDDGGRQRYWEWDVNPLTREVDVSEDDLQEIRDLIESVRGWEKVVGERDRHVIVLQNAKFDVTALESIGVVEPGSWPWDMTEDTLFAGHLLASNQPHDLTSMAMQYLGEDIKPYEDALEKAVKKCRHLVQQARIDAKRGKDRGHPELVEWLVADPGVAGMPSAKGECWKNDTWLPRAVAKHFSYEKDHTYWTVLRDYANTDSAITVMFWQAMCEELRKRGLWKIYLEKRKLMRIAQEMEGYGVTGSKPVLDGMRKRYEEEAEEAESTCAGIAQSLGYDLEMPKGAMNNSLKDFMFGPLGLSVVKSSRETGNASLDKEALDVYESTLEPRSKSLLFVRSLKRRRKRRTFITYLDGYERFAKEGCEGWFRLHPSVNPTGTATLRWSHSNPNSANISKQENECPECSGGGCDTCNGTGVDTYSLRKCFGPLPGREWWCLDYENIELRIPAYESGEEAMIELFEKPDDPPYFGSYHLLNASIVYPDLFEPLAGQKGAFKKKYAATWYQWCKNFGFALQYQAGDETADRAAHKRGAARAVRQTLRKMTALNERCVKTANELGYVETIPDRTVDSSRGYPLLCTRTTWGRVLGTVPLNYRVQGTAMQCTAKAMVRCQEKLDGWNEGLSREEVRVRGYYMPLQVHDELVFDFPRGRKENPEKVNELKVLMEKSGEDIGIPLRVSVSYCPNNWGETEELV